MAGKDIIMVRQKDLKRLHVIHKVFEEALTQGQAAEILSLSERQVRRIVRRIRDEGDGGIQHQSRGRASNRRIPKKTVDRIIGLYRQKYKGFGPTLTSEKLYELEGIQLSKETVRTYLIMAGEWKKGHKRKAYRQWRPRKEHFGEMIQMDGSHHDWFEGRAPECVLMGYIDDATGKAFARFYEYEGTVPAMDSFKRYIKKYGIPLSVYLDRHTTYKSTAKPSIEDEINGTKPMSEFERAMKELGVQVIHAYSPQAKGRVERVFGTFQDRLVKEMRLRGTKSIEEGNKFLDDYLAVHNRKFSVNPRQENNLHRAIPKGLKLDGILCIKSERVLRNDFTVAYNGKLYQMLDKTKAQKVQVEERINGTMVITYEGSRLRYREITKRPEKEQKKPIIFIIKKRNPNIPAMNHPWRRFKPVIQHNSYQQKELQT